MKKCEQQPFVHKKCRKSSTLRKKIIKSITENIELLLRDPPLERIILAYFHDTIWSRFCFSMDLSFKRTIVVKVQKWAECARQKCYETVRMEVRAAWTCRAKCLYRCFKCRLLISSHSQVDKIKKNDRISRRSYFMIFFFFVFIPPFPPPFPFSIKEISLTVIDVSI